MENVIASCAGFPKDMLNGPSTVLDKGVFGDDAWFISRFKNTFVVGKLVKIAAKNLKMKKNF